jgi:peptidoglycan/LPS O-acetylase OafA/YrhL
MKKIRFLESIRGISALVVLLFHLKDSTNSLLIHNFLILNGKIFVDFFFILSGFVIAHSYSSKIYTFIDLLKFKFKRFLRLYPLHILTLIIFVLI